MTDVKQPQPPQQSNRPIKKKRHRSPRSAVDPLPTDGLSTTGSIDTAVNVDILPMHRQIIIDTLRGVPKLVKDIFAALFFVSVGALMDFRLIPQFIIPALVLIGVSIGAKFLTVYLASRIQGVSKLSSTRAAVGLSSSGGEIALVVAKGGIDVGAASSFILPMVGTMTIITTFISPYVIKYGWKFTERYRKDRDKGKESLPSNTGNKTDAD